MLRNEIGLSLIFWVSLSALAVYRLSLILAEDTISEPFRDRIAQAARKANRSWKIRIFGFFGSLFDCQFCLGVWFSIFPAFLIARNIPEFLILWLGIAGLQRVCAYASD